MIYKGFSTTVHYSEADNNYYGLLITEDGVMLSDLVMWETDDLESIEKEFKEAVDDYLEFLNEYGVDSYLEFLDGNRKDEVENV